MILMLFGPAVPPGPGVAQGWGEPTPRPRSAPHLTSRSCASASALLGSPGASARTPRRLLRCHRFIYNKELENQWGSAFLRGRVSSTRPGSAARSHPTYPHTSRDRQKPFPRSHLPPWSLCPPCPVGPCPIGSLGCSLPCSYLFPLSPAPLSYGVMWMLAPLVPTSPRPTGSLICSSHWSHLCPGPLSLRAIIGMFVSPVPFIPVVLLSLVPCPMGSLICPFPWSHLTLLSCLSAPFAPCSPVPWGHVDAYSPDPIYLPVPGFSVPRGHRDTHSTGPICPLCPPVPRSPFPWGHH